MFTETQGLELNLFQEILRAVSSAMKIPVIIILLCFIAFSAFCIGWVIVEALTERRHMKYSLPSLLDEMKSGVKPLQECIADSGLLFRQKAALTELTLHPDFNKKMLTSLADSVLEDEENYYDGKVKITNLVSKLGPMVGLLGTLIPLGPGIIALGQGDTYTLSESMLTAFDTTVAGLIVAAVCLIISAIRTKWYAKYMSDLETLVDCVVEIQFENKEIKEDKAE